MVAPRDRWQVVPIAPIDRSAAAAARSLGVAAAQRSSFASLEWAACTGQRAPVMPCVVSCCAAGTCLGPEVQLLPHNTRQQL